MRLLWLPEVIRDAGLGVVEAGGWRARGKEMSRVDAVIWHHTVTGPNVPDRRVAQLLTDGRSDLAGPLAQLGLRRDGTWDVIASGKANHNGFGTFGNQTIGIEAYNDGASEEWPTEQVESWIVGTAAICAHLDLPVARVLGHKESDPDRKIDPHTLNMPAMRSRIAAVNTTTEPPTEQGDPFMALSEAEQKELLEKVRATDLRVQQLQQELVAPIGDDKKSRADRWSDILTALDPRRKEKP